MYVVSVLEKEFDEVQITEDKTECKYFNGLVKPIARTSLYSIRKCTDHREDKQLYEEW